MTTFSSLHFGMKTATICRLEGSEHYRKLSVPYTLGWRLQPNNVVKGIPFTGVFQFPTLWDEDCNRYLLHYHTYYHTLSVPYTLGWRLQREKLKAEAQAGAFFQFPTLWDEDCNTQFARWINTLECSFSSLHFGVKTATDTVVSHILWDPLLSVPYTLGWRLQPASPGQERWGHQQLSVPYTLGWRLQLALSSLLDASFLSLSVPYTLGWRLQLSRVWRVYYVNQDTFSSLHFGMKTATLRRQRDIIQILIILSVPYTLGWRLQHTKRN